MTQTGRHPVRDRLKDVIICGGEEHRLNPNEVEQTLMEHALIGGGRVGVTDERWGEVPVAYVTTLAPGELDVLKLRDFARARLAHFKVPKRIFVADSSRRRAPARSRKRLREQATAGTFTSSVTTNRQSTHPALSAPS